MLNGSSPRAAGTATTEGGPALEQAAELLDGRRIAVLTGAGISTDSGIPDYRGEGRRVRQPMTVQQFLSTTERRKRYWAGSHLGWRSFSSAKPNAGHFALARLEASGHVAGVVTQNVDGLHVRAGSQRVVDLHGSMDRVRCLTCGQYFARQSVAQQLLQLNPWLRRPSAVELAPDGDVQVHEIERFAVPECTVCGGILKPDVVFFGEFVPPAKYAAAASVVRAADALLIAGSSLEVNSGIRLLELALRQNMPVVVVNRGPTKGDAKATVRIEGGTSETLSALQKRLTGPHPDRPLAIEGNK